MSDRLALIPPDHLLLIAREWISNGYNENSSVKHVTKVLESAAARGDKESGWLLDKLRSRGGVPEFGLVVAKRRWVEEVMASDDSPWAQYYRGEALWRRNEIDAGSKLLKQSAEAGFAPAMSWFGSTLAEGEEKMAWVCKAAKLNDPDGLYHLALRVTIGVFELLCAAAARGHVKSMRRLVGQFADRFSAVEVATLDARHVFYCGNSWYVRPGVRNSVQQCKVNSLDANNIAVVCATGRELEGYDQFWDSGKHPHDSHVQCIDIYLAVTHRARRAALQTVAGLRELGLPRDVAVLIGKMVYATRTDAWSWWKSNILFLQ
jgi:hypothetical protein